jgi:hypothetical protein
LHRSSDWKRSATKSLKKFQKIFKGAEQAIPPTSQTTIYWIPTPWRMKKAAAAKDAQIDAILRLKCEGI